MWDHEQERSLQSEKAKRALRGTVSTVKVEAKENYETAITSIR